VSAAFRFDRAPRRVYWELTRACELACRHCRAEAVPRRAPDELTTAECRAVLEGLAAAGPPLPQVVFTGGDPLRRSDLLDLVKHGGKLGLGIAVAPSATTSLTRGAIDALKAAGVSAMSLSLDGPTAAHHDAIRGVLGCFGWTRVAACHIVAAGIPLQVNTLVAAETRPHLEDTADLVARIGARRWSLFFLVPVGRGRALSPLPAAEAESTLKWIARRARDWPFVVATTEAPHYRRIVLQQARGEPAGKDAGTTLAGAVETASGERGFGIRDGNGIMFIGATGDVTPSGFLPVVAGNVRQAGALAIYRDAPLFRALRDPDRLLGRCGRCSFRVVCGGSRARAWAVLGDVLAEDPLCAWDPPLAAA
jgi:radical SAM protein